MDLNFIEKNEKIEDLLNLSMQATPNELEKSAILSTGIIGVDVGEAVWEVIVKYQGDIQRLAGPDVQVEELIAGYAIITLPERLIDSLAELEEIEYIEKPKSIYPQDFAGRVASCMIPVTNPPLGLTGEGVLVAVIDSGIDYANPAFRNADGSTRILAIYDQGLDREFSEAEINLALEQPTVQERMEIVPSRDITGHGSAVASVAAASVGTINPVGEGVASKSQMLVVKLDTKAQESFPLTTNIMRAFNYVVRKAIEVRMPLAINLSYGNTYGAHDGTSLLERFLDNVADMWKTTICVGSGNEGAASGHAYGRLRNNIIADRIPFTIANYERGLSIQLWKNYVDSYRVILHAPDGQSIEIRSDRARTIRERIGDTHLLVYTGTPKPYTVNQEIFIDFIPLEVYLQEGVWEIEIIPERVVSGEYKLYMPSSTIRSSGTRFLLPSTKQTLTIPSTAAKVITVGAYDVYYNAFADFSGRGYEIESIGIMENLAKPNLVAPGVNVPVVAEDSYAIVSGTSYATPYVTGSAALLMEWGIVRGNDPFLYGEKLKAYLQRGAKPLPGFEEYPNPQTGWGALCVADSLPSG